jgi:hypothetical protein
LDTSELCSEELHLEVKILSLPLLADIVIWPFLSVLKTDA